MNPLSHRCCQHNHSFGWPYFADHVFMATSDNGLCAALYTAATVTLRVGDGTPITLKEDTRYPFEEQVRLSLTTPNPVTVPLYLRVPNWCQNAAVRINNQPVSLKAQPGRFIRIEREWKNGDTVAYTLPMQIQTRTWTKNHNSVSIDYGPLTFSLKIDERYEPCDPTQTAVWFQMARHRRSRQMACGGDFPRQRLELRPGTQPRQSGRVLYPSQKPMACGPSLYRQSAPLK